MSSAFRAVDIGPVPHELRIRRQREEVDEDLREADLLEDLAGLAVTFLIGQLRRRLGR